MNLRVGLVCPYSFDAPGGVQSHVRDLAEVLVDGGHHVSVLTPGDPSAKWPAYVVPVGRAVPVPYNGSVARVAFGPLVAARVRRWLREGVAGGGFDVVHIHEPITPSVSVLALLAAEAPVVATFHSAQTRSRALSAGATVLRPALDRVAARIAVSETARDTLVRHVGGEPAVLVPNGVHLGRFATAQPRPEWQGETTLAFVGRFDEPRKGLGVLASALPRILGESPGTRVVMAGSGDPSAALDRLPDRFRQRVLVLGHVDDAEKAAMLAGADVLVAPNTHGESFGIVLVEAMAAGAAVVASDLPAFRRVLDEGRCGALFGTGDAAELAACALRLLGDPAARRTLVDAARGHAAQYDWDRVAEMVLSVYRGATEPDAVGRRGA